MCKPKVRDDVHPEQSPDRERLIHRRAEEQVKQVHSSCVLEAFLLDDIHYGSRNLGDGADTNDYVSVPCRNQNSDRGSMVTFFLMNTSKFQGISFDPYTGKC